MDQRLSESEERELTEHLASCPACAEEQARYIGIESLFADARWLPVPGGFSQHVMRRIHQRRTRLAVLRGFLAVVIFGLVAVGTLALLTSLLNPVFQQLVRYPFFAWLVTTGEGIAAVLRTVVYALRLVLSTVLNSLTPYVVGYLALAALLLLAWTRTVVLSRRSSGMILQNNSR